VSAIAERQVEEMAFLGSFLQYAIIMVILAAIALAGFFAGKKLRENKDAKAAAEADTAAEQEVK
jgi:hypothetical protein